MTLSEWLDIWPEQMAVTLRPTTLEHYRKDLENHVKPHLGSKLLTQLTAADLRKLYDALKQTGRVKPRFSQGSGLSSATVHGIHTTLHHALKTAKDQGLIPVNPSDEVEPPKVIRHPMKILNEEQLDTFLKIIETDEIWYDFFYTELTTGLRRGEICGLMWSDFDERSGILKVIELFIVKRAADWWPEIPRPTQGHGKSFTALYCTAPAGAKEDIFFPLDLP